MELVFKAILVQEKLYFVQENVPPLNIFTASPPVEQNLIRVGGAL